MRSRAGSRDARAHEYGVSVGKEVGVGEAWLARHVEFVGLLRRASDFFFDVIERVGSLAVAVEPAGTTKIAFGGSGMGEWVIEGKGIRQWALLRGKGFF